MKPERPPLRARRRPLHLALGLTALLAGAWALHAALVAVPAPVEPGVVQAARAPVAPEWASPFGSGPVAVPADPPPQAPQEQAQTQAVAPKAPGQPAEPMALVARQPTLDAAERAEVRALLAQARAQDADTARELEALLFQDALQRLLSLRADAHPGDSGAAAAEAEALAQELRAGLPAREAAGDLPAAVLAQARAALHGSGRGAASPFAAPR